MAKRQSWLEALQAWRPCGPGGPSGLEALRAWGPFGPGGPSGLSLPPTISTTILLGESESCFNPFSYFLIFLHMTLFFWKFIPAKLTALYNFFLARTCRNVQITLGINLRHSLIKASTHLNLLTSPQAKNGNNFFLPTSLFCISAVLHNFVDILIFHNIIFYIVNTYSKNTEFSLNMLHLC